MKKFVFSAMAVLLLALEVRAHSVAAQGNACNFALPIDGGLNGYYAFGERTTYENAHTGEDLVYPQNTAVHAVEFGRVIWAGWWPAEGERNWTGFGPVVFVEHDCGGIHVLSFYAHLDPTIPVTVGQLVAKGEIIGKIGPITPASNTPHLHLGFRLEGDPKDGYAIAGKWEDPKEFLSGSLQGLGVAANAEPNKLNFDWQSSILPCLWLQGMVGVFWLALAIRRPASQAATSATRSAVDELIYRLFWGPDPGTWRAWKAGAVVAMVVNCLFFAVFGYLQIQAWRRAPIVQSTNWTMAELSGKGTAYAAIYGRYHGWGTVGTLKDPGAIVEKAVSNAELVSSWQEGAAVQPVVILNIAGAGSSIEDEDVVKRILEVAQKRNVIVMLDVQPTPDGVPFAKLCEEAVGYVSAYPGGVWLSIDSEHFLQNSFSAREINACADSYDEALRRVGAHGIVGVWEFGVYGHWLVDDPKSVIRQRSSSVVVPLFSGFGAYPYKVHKFQEMQEAYSGAPIGVAEWQSLYPEKYDKDFVPKQLLDEQPLILIHY